ncbi:MAG: hypothetical protein SRB2_01525 [Desulfobacteraceae bacterium Eth-SRB2]|nr:MAG: hypothetical protein SRB2_01525 [Desulfobacteraceae bacterium Eth-SRB2]
MTNQMKILDELELAFKRLINLLPDPLKGDDHTQQIILTYLKLGGEKLARQRIEIIKIHFREKALKEPSETQRPLDFHVAGSHISEPYLSESDSLEFPTE